MKVVGLAIDGCRLGVAIIQRGIGRTELAESFAETFASEGELLDVLRKRAAGWSGARIVSVIPGRACLQRSVTLPFTDRKRIEKALPFEIEDTLPFGLDDLVIDHLQLDGSAAKKDAESRVLCLLLPRTALREHLALLETAGIDPHAVVPSLAALSTVARMMPAGDPAYLAQGSDICLAHGGRAAAVRTVGTSATGGLRHIVQALETERKERVDKAVLLGSDPARGAAFAELGIAVEEAVPELGGKRAADAISLGAALTAEMNFRKGEFAYRRADEGSRRRIRALLIAGAAAALLFCVNIAVKYSLVQSSYGSLDRDIREIFHQTFPDVKSAGDPVRQMRDRLADAKKRFGALGSGTSALDVMKSVTDSVPKDVRVSFTEFTLEGDRLKLQGEAPSFEAVDKVKAELQRSTLFADVSVLDTRMGVDSKVKFRVDIRLKQGM